MKKIVLILVTMMSGVVFAQNIEPKLEAVGQLVKATYFYDNGAIQQEGYFKDGKLEGKWVSYESNGNIKATAEYSNGMKTGKWSYHTENLNVTEVDYSNNVIVAVNTIKSNVIVDKN